MDIDLDVTAAFCLENPEILRAALVLSFFGLLVHLLLLLGAEPCLAELLFFFVHREMFLDGLFSEEMKTVILVEGVDAALALRGGPGTKLAVVAVNAAEVASDPRLIGQLHGCNIATGPKRVLELRVLLQ
jgi:hypothetical protein